MADEEIRARIVDQLRRKGWDRLDAEEEADTIIAKNAAKRKLTEGNL